MQIRSRHVALATLTVVAATYAGTIAVWTQLPGSDPAGGAVVVHSQRHAAGPSTAGMKMAPGMKMPGMSR
jgi:hypothetical protein